MSMHLGNRPSFNFTLFASTAYSRIKKKHQLETHQKYAVWLEQSSDNHKDKTVALTGIDMGFIQNRKEKHEILYTFFPIIDSTWFACIA